MNTTTSYSNRQISTRIEKMIEALNRYFDEHKRFASAQVEQHLFCAEKNALVHTDYTDEQMLALVTVWTAKTLGRAVLERVE